MTFNCNINYHSHCGETAHKTEANIKKYNNVWPGGLVVSAMSCMLVKCCLVWLAHSQPGNRFHSLYYVISDHVAR